LEDPVDDLRNLRHEVVDEVFPRAVEADLEYEVRRERVVVDDREAAAVQRLERAQRSGRSQRQQPVLELDLAAFVDRRDDGENALLHGFAKRTSRRRGVIPSL